MHYIITVHAGSIHHPAAEKIAAVGTYAGNTTFFYNKIQKSCPCENFHPIHQRILNWANAGRKWINHPGSGGEHGSADCRIDQRFTPAHLIAIDQVHRNTVLPGTFIQRVNTPQFIRANGHYVSARAAKRDPKVR